MTDLTARRNPRLDELRAVAIFVVVLEHVVQRWPVPHPEIVRFTDFGMYGVDIFFVLSGWLIGTLYWKELRRTQDVQIGRFIFSRLSRTIIPYLFALGIAWLGVRYFRGERFDWGYLLFLQNYYLKIPYFNASWSLCVEEHFYLLLPLTLLVLRRSKVALHVVLLAVVHQGERAAMVAPVQARGRHLDRSGIGGFHTLGRTVYGRQPHLGDFCRRYPVRFPAGTYRRQDSPAGRARWRPLFTSSVSRHTAFILRIRSRLTSPCGSCAPLPNGRRSDTYSLCPRPLSLRQECSLFYSNAPFSRGGRNGRRPRPHHEPTGPSRYQPRRNHRPSRAFSLYPAFLLVRSL